MPFYKSLCLNAATGALSQTKKALEQSCKTSLVFVLIKNIFLIQDIFIHLQPIKKHKLLIFNIL